ncbi:MAG: DUF1851 domain-containing protein [Bacteroidetes bacterium]|nr:DUF1851 domain-containing protein [Bacteroidota bacterium]
MRINLDDLTVKFNEVVADKLTVSWTWLIGTNKKPILVSAIGDMFLQANSKEIYWLDVGGGEMRLIANGIQDFEEKLKNIEQVNEWFMIDLAMNLRLSDKKLKDGQLYSYKKLPIIGGDYTADNFVPLDIVEHFCCTGDLHKQIKDLPDGTMVEIKIVE